MSMFFQCPTVKIKHGKKGFSIINEKDFDPEKHELYVEGKKSKDKK